MALISLNWSAALALEDSLGIELKPVQLKPVPKYSKELKAAWEWLQNILGLKDFFNVQELRDNQKYAENRPENPFTPQDICRHKSHISECYWCTMNGKTTKARLFYNNLDELKGKRPKNMVAFSRKHGVHQNSGYRMFKKYTNLNASGKWNIMYEDD